MTTVEFAQTINQQVIGSTITAHNYEIEPAARLTGKVIQSRIPGAWVSVFVTLRPIAITATNQNGEKRRIAIHDPQRESLHRMIRIAVIVWLVVWVVIRLVKWSRP